MAKNFTFTLDETTQRRFKEICVSNNVSLSKRIEELMKYEIDGDIRRFEEIEKRIDAIDSLLISAKIGETSLDGGDGSGF